ncbi:MAG: CDGSH iron-sulfur domain-containing protein [Burkholderiales bacterium]|nr:CDGSH iron-sulfur domain-containing protein [Burkholderiales bacterium]
MSERPTIECTPDGPYLVRGVEDLRDWRGDRIEAKPVMALCRCGGSANKPFCDGTHQKNGFSGAKLADGSADKRDSYPAEGIVIHDNRSICAHAGLCTDALASVFKYKSEPWIDPAGGAVEAIIETIRRCPSGALSYTLDEVGGGDQQRDAAITVTKDGPYAVTGGAQLPEQSWARGASTERYTLCRCGASRNKPFCDGSHWSAGFSDETQ